MPSASFAAQGSFMLWSRTAWLRAHGFGTCRAMVTRRVLLLVRMPLVSMVAHCSSQLPGMRFVGVGLVQHDVFLFLGRVSHLLVPSSARSWPGVHLGLVEPVRPRPISPFWQRFLFLQPVSLPLSLLLSQPLGVLAAFVPLAGTLHWLQLQMLALWRLLELLPPWPLPLEMLVSPLLSLPWLPQTGGSWHWSLKSLSSCSNAWPLLW